MGLFKKNKEVNMNAYINKRKVRLADYNKKKKSPREYIIKGGILAIIFGIYCILFGGLMIFLTYNKDKSLEHINGYVIESKQYFIFRGFYKSTIEYEVDGQIYKIKRYGISTSPDTINDKYEVLYSKVNPNSSYLIWNEKAKVRDLFVYGIGILIIGFILFKGGNRIIVEREHDDDLEIPMPNEQYLKFVAEEKARIEAEIAAEEAEKARIAAEEAAAQAQAEAEKASGITAADRVAKAAEGMEIAFLDVDPSQMLPKQNQKNVKVEDDGLDPAAKAAKAAQGMDIAFLEVDPSQMVPQTDKKRAKAQEDDGLDPAARAAKAAAGMEIAFLDVDPSQMVPQPNKDKRAKPQEDDGLDPAARAAKAAAGMGIVFSETNDSEKYTARGGHGSGNQH